MLSMANLGRLSIRLNRKSVENSGKHWRKRPPTSFMRHGPDLSVSSRESGKVTSTRDAVAATPAPTQATGRLRSTASRTVNTTMTAPERSAWLMPAR